MMAARFVQADSVLLDANAATIASRCRAYGAVQNNLRYASTRCTRTRGLIGLRMNPSNAVVFPTRSVVELIFAENATTGIAPVSGSDFRRLLASQPSIPGRPISMRTRSG